MSNTISQLLSPLYATVLSLLFLDNGIFARRMGTGWQAGAALVCNDIDAVEQFGIRLLRSTVATKHCCFHIIKDRMYQIQLFF